MSDKNTTAADLIWPADFMAEINSALKESRVEESFRDKTFREVLFIFPFLKACVYTQKEIYLIGKVKEENDPYDVVLIPLKDIEIKNGKIFIYHHIFMQVKSLPINRINDLNDLKVTIEEAIEKASRTKPGIPGVLYIYNLSPFTVKCSNQDIDSVLEKIKISNNVAFQSIAFASSFNVQGENFDAVWFLYPGFKPSLWMGNREMAEITKLYKDGSEQYGKTIFPELFDGLDRLRKTFG